MLKKYFPIMKNVCYLYVLVSNLHSLHHKKNSNDKIYRRTMGTYNCHATRQINHLSNIIYTYNIQVMHDIIKNVD